MGQKRFQNPRKISAWARHWLKAPLGDTLVSFKWRDLALDDCEISSPPVHINADELT